MAATLATEPKEQVHYLLNDLQQNNMPYIPSVERTVEDDKALTWNAKLFESTKRTHCNAERFEAIFKETMTYITTTEHHMYMDIQKGLTTEREFMAWLRSYFNRTYPEMRNDNDFSIMYERLHTAVFQYYVLQPLIDHDDTSDIKVCAPDDIRVRVKGKAYKSTCNFLSVNDLYQFIEGLALRNGLDFSHPEITFTDSHDKHYILRFLISAPAVNAVDYPYLHIRKVPKDKPGFDKLIKDEMLTPMVVEYLKDRIKTSKGIVISGPPGCVDKDTEFFNGRQWKSIADYKDGEQVLQFDTATGEASLVTPLRYIREPCSMMYHFETKYGINQTLSPEHRVIYYKKKKVNGKKIWSDEAYEMSAEQLASLQNEGKFYGGFKTGFYYNGSGLDLSDIELRIMLAVICDGTFPRNTNRCRVHLKKQRKIDEMRLLLNEWGYPYQEKECCGYTNFLFNAPRREKIFSADWYNCSQEQLRIVCANVLQWDGHQDEVGRKLFTSTSKQSADFVQFAFSACGYRATIHRDNRKGQNYQTSGKIYLRKSDTYDVIICDKTIVSMQWHNDGRNNNVTLNPVIPEDGFKYCFTVPTHALVLRRNNRIFITGNSGKSTLLNAGLEVIPKTRETLVIQENDELHTKQSGFMFKHVTHGFHGEPVIELEELGKMALVEGCNEFIIGEVKGGEMRYAATLMRSGGYCMYTTHSLSARETLPRCADLVKQGSDYSYEDACKMLKNVETVVFMEDYQVQEILEVKGFDVTTQEFIYRPIYRNPHPRYAADSGDFGTVNSSKGEGLAATQQGEGKDVGKDGIFIYPKKEESIYSSGGTPSEHRSSPPPSPLNGAKSSLNHQTDDSAIPDFSSILSE